MYSIISYLTFNDSFFCHCFVSVFRTKGKTWCSDQGYWTPSLLFDFILRCGGDVVGTVAWNFQDPFTFIKEKRKETDDAAATTAAATTADIHNPTEIPMKGQKDVFYKTLQWAGLKIRATCYRSGTGTAVTLAMLSIHHNPIYYLNLAFPKDQRWYFDKSTSQLSQDEKYEKTFPVIAGLPRGDFSVIKNLPIVPLTLVQGDTVWFNMRMLALSLLTVDKCISSQAREIAQGHAMQPHYEVVLQAVNQTNLLLQQETDEHDENDGNNLNNNVTSRRRGDHCNDRDEEQQH